MNRNKKAKYDATDLSVLARAAVKGAKERRARVLEEAELAAAAGGRAGAGGGGTRGPVIVTEGMGPVIPKELLEILTKGGSGGGTV